MDALIDIVQEKKGDVLVLKLAGRLDATSSPVLEKKIFSLIEAENYKLLINFEKVEYLSSAGMRLLLSTTKKLKSKKGKIILCCAVDNVIEVIKMAGFDRILNIKETEQEAYTEF